ncbi:tyrosine-type recombinase/integrase [Clostridium tyrobutyricum]|uniref:tyrosine-type recombinase/integrase n=1 Tax=Clostridium tyrobutyricum TaxID=1519 RepID=UPI001C386EF0|nr:tyrosine-type recombinase/integrase [Clostridium tyrobutyricum]MBV4431893.1 tyrosine-type recombinase/integrase [Clostridium tyrobutyricum]
MLPLNDLIKEFKFDMECRKLSPRTIRTDITIVKGFCQYLKNEFNIIELQQIRSPSIKKYINYLDKQGRSEKYMNSILKCIRAFYRYCIQEEYISPENNPVRKVKWVKEEKKLIETFTDSEAKKMLKQWDYTTFYNARNKAIVALLFETGIRNLELCSLNMADVRDEIILIHGKGNKQRYVPISPALKRIFIKYARVRTGYIKNKFITTDAYFISFRGNRLTIETIERVIRQTGKKAKVRSTIRCSPHTIRHYYAQFMLRHDEDIYTVSRLLGHENVNITKIYLQSLKDKEIVNMSMDTSPLMKLRG